MPSEWFEAPTGADHPATAPTVMAPAAAPGDPIVVGSSPEFPAATTTIFPAAAALFTAWLTPSKPSDGVEVPRLIEMTRALARPAHQSIPAITWLSDPEPAEFRTLAAESEAPGATPPYLAASGPPVESPTAIAATWVPCPLSS